MKLLYHNIGYTIKIIRQQRGYTQKELCSKLNITVNFLSLIETNVRKPSLAVLCDIAKTLNCDLELNLHERK